MNRLFYLFILLICLVFQNEFLFAQMGGHGQGHMNPDSLTAVTVNGTAIVDTNFVFKCNLPDFCFDNRRANVFIKCCC